MAFASWLSRYRHGDRDRVWHELRQLGDRVQGPVLLDDAQAVCDEVARRARHNLDLILERLTNAGYRFFTNDDQHGDVVPFVPATDAAPGHARWLQETFGPVPLTVLSWVRLVGDVWLVGDHPRSPGSAAASDPLVIEIDGSRYPGESMRDHQLEELDVWRDQNADQTRPGLFALPVAPDRLAKDNVSGGLPYGLVLPDGCADALFVGETTMPFVSYLNWVFTHGGFPHTAGSDHDWWQVRTSLAQDLLPL